MNENHIDDLAKLEARIKAKVDLKPKPSIQAQIQAIKLVIDNRINPLKRSIVELESRQLQKGEKGQDGKSGKDGIGRDGRDGKEGGNGRDGKDGKDGKSVAGKDGVSVVDAEIAADDHLVFTLSNGKEIDAGEMPTSNGSSIFTQVAGGSGSGVSSITAGTNITVTGTATVPIVNAPTMTATVGGAVPTPPNNTSTFLRGDGTFATPAGAGDMVLANTQTNSGLKTFLDGTVGLRNVANTFTILFTNAVTAARNVTWPDKAGTVAMTNDKLSAFAATSSAELAGVISDETGSGALVFSNSPVFTTPNIGSATGSVSGNSATVTTNANLTGHITSTGNAAILGSFTLAQLNTAVSDADVARVDAANTFVGIQTITNITLPSAGQVKLTVPTVDLKATGPTCGDFNCGYTSSAIGDLVYLDSTGVWQKTDANTLALYNGLLGVALEIKAAANALLVALPGSFIYSTTGFPTMTIASPLYMSETPGAITHTQPVTLDAAIRVIGWAVHANKIWFQPSPNYITHV